MRGLTKQEKITLSTYNKVAKIWVKNHHDAEFWKSEMEKFRQLLAGGRIIDIGAGGVGDAIGLTALGYDYTGVDISNKLLEIAREQLPGQKFYKQSIYELSFPEKFDGFWCSAVLLHIPKAKIDKALQRIKSVVRPGAIGFISIKDGRSERVETERWADGKYYQRFFSYWSKAEFRIALRRNGFSVVDYAYRTDSPKTKWHCFYVVTNT